jgi:hypothetical protein
VAQYAPKVSKGVVCEREEDDQYDQARAHDAGESDGDDAT